MYKLVCSELLKSKRTLLRPILFMGAAVFSVLLMIVWNLAPDTLENSWEHYTRMIFHMWAMTFQSLGLSLLCILTEYREKKNNTYRSVYTEARSVGKVWSAKILSMIFYSFAANGLMTLFVLGLALSQKLGAGTLLSAAEMGAAVWLMSFAVIPLVLFQTHRFGSVGAAGAGLFGLIFAPVMAPESCWVLNPYSYAVRGIVPLTGIHPNGISLEKADPLMNTGTMAEAFGLSLVCFAVFTLITAVLFSKREGA